MLSQDEGQTCLVDWTVRAPGYVGQQHFVDGFANSSLAGDNQSADFQVNITGVGGQRAIALALSNALSAAINWNITILPASQQGSVGNNGTNVTEFKITISAVDTSVDVYMRGSGDITTSGGINRIGLGNETFSFNSTNNEVPSASNYTLTTNFSNNKIGSSLINGSAIYLKFFLNVSGAQAAGAYNNTVEIKAVEAGQDP